MCRSIEKWNYRSKVANNIKRWRDARAQTVSGCRIDGVYCVCTRLCLKQLRPLEFQQLRAIEARSRLNLFRS